MPGNSFGYAFRITTWGESHGPAVGVVIDGCPAGLALCETDIQKELDKRKPGASDISSQRKEPDAVIILSGVFEGKTTGTPISLLVQNKASDTTPYERNADRYRPGHADYTYELKYGIRDWRGGGRASARETVARVAAGAVAKKLLQLLSIRIRGYVAQIGRIKIETFTDSVIDENPVRCPDPVAAAQMIDYLTQLKSKGDSTGSLVKLIISHVPVGLGEPVFMRIHAQLAQAFFSIPGVKGVEFGSGFSVCEMTGSMANDQMYSEDSDNYFRTNNAGGSLGGITSGQDITARIAFKPPPSIAQAQSTIDRDGNPVSIEVHGHHDPVIGPRGIIIVEAMAALVLVDMLLMRLMNTVTTAISQQKMDASHG